MSDNMESGERLKQIRRLCELFRGRFTETQSRQILQHYNYDVQEAANFLSKATPEERRNKFGNTFMEVEFVRRDEVLKELARNNEVGWEMRLFVCASCRQHSWWRRVPKRKPVSKCNKCRVRYDPIPHNQEFGWGKFDCRNCGNKFSAFAVMDMGIFGDDRTGKSENYCFECNHKCEPVEILPPSKRSKRPRSRRSHSCSAENCFNRRPVQRTSFPGTTQHVQRTYTDSSNAVNRGSSSTGVAMIIQTCVHPKSNPIRVPDFGSNVHVSTGSTVDTFLTQNDVDTIALSDFRPMLDDIPECDSDTDYDA